MKRSDVSWNYLLAMMNSSSPLPPLDPEEDPPVWSALPVLSLLLVILTILLNVLVLILIHWARVFKDTLYFYICNLLIANILYKTFQGSISVVDRVYSYWWMANSVCTFYMYCQYVLLLSQITARLLITLEGIRATFCPLAKWISSPKCAVFVCIGAWLFTHVFCVYGVVKDALERIPMDFFGCQVNFFVPGLFRWLVAFGTVRVAEFLVIVVGFVVVACKQARKKKGDGKGEQSMTEVTRKTDLRSDVAKDNNSCQPAPSSEFVHAVRLPTYTGLELHPSSSSSDPPKPEASPPEAPCPVPEGPVLSTHIISILRRLSLIVIVFWTPKIIYSIVEMASTRSPRNLNTREGLALWHDLAALFDPLIILACVSELRKCCRRQKEPAKDAVSVGKV